MQIFGKTDAGKVRSVNQDNFRIKEYFPRVQLAVICDGMGGALGGSEASATAIEAFCTHMDSTISGQTQEVLSLIPEKRIKKWMIESTDDANDMVYVKSCSEEELKGMGTTLVACLRIENKLYVVNVGDSRMYLVFPDHIKQITHDHSYVQFLVDLGKMTSEEARTSINKNIITRAIGTDSTVEIDFFKNDISAMEPKPQYVLLSTDGLTNMLPDDEIAKIISKNNKTSIDKILDSLIERANNKGGVDNITTVLVNLQPEEKS